MTWKLIYAYYWQLRRSLLLLFLFIAAYSASAQYIFREASLPAVISILPYAEIADAGHQDLTIEQVRKGELNLNYRKLSGNFGNLGFTNRNYWLRFELVNSLDIPLTYYLETAEPITDNVNLYLFNSQGVLQLQRSGDNLHFKNRALEFRKTLFEINLEPFEKKSAWMEVRNDGEKNTLPLQLHSTKDLLSEIYNEQILFGLFYGILFTITVTYLFFFFALGEITFLYYSLYVLFTGLCHAALDGVFHKYFLQDNNWFSLHAVIIFAVGGCYFFGKYSEIVLDIRGRNRQVHHVLRWLYRILGLVLAGIVFFPAFLSYSYPIVNLLTLSGMLLIVITIAAIFIRKQEIDWYYVSGISVLFICFTLVICFNFGYTYNSLLFDNLSKIGIALELIALSLSMANRIRELKSKKEELQGIALQRSQEMNDMKSYFLSNMSHELRTPLNAVIGLAQVMENDITDPKLKANFALLKHASANLVSSVNDILDFSKIEKGQLKLDSVSFSPRKVLDAVMSRFSMQAQNKGLAFDYDCPLDQEILVFGDPLRLDQMLNNILNNAVKFTAHGKISLNADILFNENGSLILTVKITDTGEGIPPEKLETVYQMFSQVEVDNKRRFGGFGIGLCIVKALVELHHGKISLTSELHRGTTCTIILDYYISEILKPKSVFPQDEYNLLDRRVLVVEDNPMNQMVLKMIFNKWKNTKVSFANDGSHGLEVLQASDFDIVLMDLQMPVMDGYEAISAIRSGMAGEKRSNIPIIAVTADLMQDTKDRVFELGVNDYITKPVDQQQLYEKMTSHLS